MTRRGRVWLAVAGLGALTAAGAVFAAVGPRPGDPVDTAGEVLAPAFAPSTLPADVTAGFGPGPNGQSVVAAAGRAAPGGIVLPQPALFDPDTVRAAEVRLAIPARSYRDVFGRVAEVAAGHSGFVASSSSSLDKDGSAGQLVLRVPTDRFDLARQAVAGLGDVESETLRGQDVTAQLVDYDARLRSLQAQEDTLRALAARVTTVSEVLQIQPSLQSVRQQIETVEAQRTRVKDAATLSTILVTLHEPGAMAPERVPHERSPLGRRLDQAVDGALAVVGGVIVAVGWLVPVVAVGGPAYLLVFVRRRRRRSAPTTT